MKKHSRQSSKSSRQKHNSGRFTLGRTLKIVLGIFVVWTVYRVVFHFPEWVDEGIAKAIVFGIPAWLYCRARHRGEDKLGLSNSRFWSGMFFGLFVGGIYQFLAAVVLLLRNIPLTQAGILQSPMFWYIFLLALLTAWWESVFFFGYVLNAFKDALGGREIPAVLAATGVFLLFHAPLRLVQFGANPVVLVQLALLGVFAMGQAIVYLRTRSIYSITISHALWGLMLLVYAV